MAVVTSCGFEPREAKPTGFDTSISLRENVDAYVLARVPDDYPGFTVLVLHDGTKLVESTYGRVQRDVPDEATSSTPFYLSDVSMQFTAVATLMLYEDGALPLETKAVDVVPNLPANWEPITVHHLLAHESGIPDYTTDLDSLESGLTNEMVLQEVATAPLQFPPGSRFHVSRTGYVLLAEIVEGVSGQRFADFVRDSVFDRLGMTSSLVVDETGPDVPGHAVGYATLDSIAEYDGRSTGDAGVYSTLDNMETWLRALDGGVVLTPEAAALMYTPHVADRYGYGWYVGAWNEMPAYFLDGSEAGYRSFVGRVPDDNLSYAILSSGAYTWAFDLPSLIMGYVLGF